MSAIGSAMHYIYDTLESFGPKSRQRVLSAVAILLETEAPTITQFRAQLPRKSPRSCLRRWGRRRAHR